MWGLLGGFKIVVLFVFVEFFFWLDRFVRFWLVVLDDFDEEVVGELFLFFVELFVVFE